MHGLSKRHDISRNLIRIWIEKYQAGTLDEDVAAADLLQSYEARIAALERLVGKQALELEFLRIPSDVAREGGVAAGLFRVRFFGLPKEWPMPAKKAAMRQVRDVVRMRAAGISAREVAIRIGVAPSTVRLTMKRLADAGLDEAAIAGMSDETLEARLFSRVGTM